MMNETYFTPAHREFRFDFRAFLKKEVVPFLDEWEKNGEIPREIFKKFGDQGYFSLAYPEKYGGMNDVFDLFYVVVWLEEMQRINSGGFAAAMWAHCFLPMQHLNAEASDDLKEKYLRPSIAGTKVGALAMTEPGAGSDLAGMKTTAVRDGDHYLINGSKTFITNGFYGDYVIIAVLTDPSNPRKGMSMFVVDLDTPGITKNKLDKLGWRASDTAELFFDNVKVPVSNLLGKENDGFLYLAMHLAMERIIMAINAHARAEYAIEYTLKYMKERTAFGKNLDKFQALRHTIADFIIDVDHIKTYNYKVIEDIVSGGYPVKEASSAKRKSTKVADDVISGCLQMLGGYGYMEEYELARMLRDSRLGQIGGGTSEIMKEIVAKIAIDGKEFKKPVLDL